MIKYERPIKWLIYNPSAIVNDLAAAKASVLALMKIPFQRSWADRLQELQLKREIAGTSRIEGADFTDTELDQALKKPADETLTRSQRQAAAALRTYQWVLTVPDDRPIDESLVRAIHAQIIEGADDDHCSPGQLRGSGQNVVFGIPQHRGAEGGDEVKQVFAELLAAANGDFRGHDLLVQALTLHYHFASIHPFLDGNGRTARALEAMLLQRAGLKNLLFIALSNYYYDEKPNYLSSLAAVRANGHDLTPFLIFGLRGVTRQCEKLLVQISAEVSKALFRDVMHELYRRLTNQRKRIIVERQIEILNCLLEVETMEFGDLYDRVMPHYQSLTKKSDALARDLVGLKHLGAINYWRTEDDKTEEKLMIQINLAWPTQITQTDLYKRFREMPEAKTHWFR